MALQKQIIPLSLGQGIDTKGDTKQQILGKLRKAQNVVYETISELRKRNGYDLIRLITTTGDRLADSQILTKFKSELCLFTLDKFYGFSTSLQELQERGSVYSVMPTSTPILNNNYNHDGVDATYVEGLKVIVYHNTTTNDVRYSVQDAVSGSLLVSDDVVATGAERIEVANIQNYVYLIYTQGANIAYRRFNILEPQTLEAVVAIAANVDAAFPSIDSISVGDKVVVAYNSTVGGAKVKVFAIQSDGSLSSIVGVATSDGSFALDLSHDANSRIIVMFASATELRYAILSYTITAVLLASTVVEALAGIVNVSSVETSSGVYQTYYEVSAAATFNHYVKQVQVQLNGTVGAATVFLRSVGLSSKVFQQSAATYVPVLHASTLQSTYFLVDASGCVAAKVSPGLGGGLITTASLPKSVPLSNSAVLFVSQIKGRTDTDTGVFFSLLGVNSTVLEFAPADPFQTAYLGSNLHITGGVLQMYDGDHVVEHGFHLYPETLIAGATATTGGFMSNGNYGYKAVYMWTDNQGNEHRSVPSLSLTVVLAGGTATQTQAITVPTLRVTAKAGVVIELYRTEDNGTIYYKVSSTTVPTFSTTTADTVSILDTLSDVSILSRQPLYTTGGVLENTGAPALSIVAVHTASNRLFGVGEQPNTLLYSKIQQAGGPVEWNDTQSKQVDPVGGPITAVTSMDEKLIVFEQDAIMYVSGSGPNNLGQQDTFTDPERVSIDVGCIEPRSVVLTPNGVMFKSRKGIYLLTRALSLEYKGAPVEEFNGLNITSAKVIGEKNQVRFTTSDGDCLVYHSYVDLWATFTNHQASSAEVVDNEYYYLRTGAELFQENRTSFSDNGVPIKLLVESGWFSFNQLQGFMRVYKLMVLGDYRSEHTLRIRLAYDFNEAFVQEKVVNPLNFIDNTPYGGYSPYGTPIGEPYGGDGNVYQARIDFTKQKCQSFKVRIEDQQSTPGEGLRLSAMTLQVGGKQGLNRVSNTRKYGTGA